MNNFMKLENCMATKTPKSSQKKPGESCTDFQLHKSQSSHGNKREIIDFTEKKLMNFIERSRDEQQKSTLVRLLDDYRRGAVAVAWKGGKPIWFNVTKETSRG